MARDNIFMRLAAQYRVKDEIEKLEDLLSKDQVEYSHNQYMSRHSKKDTIYALVGSIFYIWNGRGTAITLEEFVYKTGIREIIEKINGMEELSEEEIINYLEYAYNILRLFYLSFEDSQIDFKAYTFGKEIVNRLIDVMGLQVLEIKDLEGFELVVASPLAIQVAEDTSEDLGILVLRYNHHLLKGDLMKKKDILRHMAGEFESQRPCLESFGLRKLASDTGYCLNNLDIRHNNQEKVTQVMNNNEIEEWYDKTYQLLLLCLASHSYMTIHSDVSVLKQKMEGAVSE